MRVMGVYDTLFYMEQEIALQSFLKQSRGWRVIDHMLSLYQHNALPHFLLLTGPWGMGKHLIVEELVQLMFCTAQSGDGPCLHCRECELVHKKTHHDVVVLEGTKKSGAVSVDQARDLKTWAYKSTDHIKVVVVPHAATLTESAANALLKILEEPPRHFRVMMLAEHEEAILPTLRSRAVHIHALPPEPEVLKRFRPHSWDAHALLRQLYATRKIGMLWTLAHQQEVFEQLEVVYTAFARLLAEPDPLVQVADSEALVADTKNLPLFELALYEQMHKAPGSYEACSDRFDVLTHVQANPSVFSHPRLALTNLFL